ncbi:MAG: ABC transporter permease subunit [Anaerolineae bacterium]|uniref:PstA family ABC transporter permease n=1 Tax=Promineifilum sp. TaxID=2664178 RepID=UPI001D52D082|nr:ABC transporter permease subunit [Anaerolineales bacterium]MCB8934827.1 ABC transporter permease subunit [Promineifilum sp.]MCO5181245.1 ABC transporter permease subunit [Promineifilum sp.]MCW5848076.1 ABC transporter permease subunit [Anaerolineae bacterium]
MTYNRRRKLMDKSMRWVLRLSIASAGFVLLLILGIITWRGIGGMSWDMITKPPEGSFYLGGGGGVLNAILGSVVLALGATALAAVIAVPVVLYIHTYAGKSRLAGRLRLALDVMWGIPSIVYGAFGFSLMLLVGLRASLLAGIVTVAFVALPILARTFDEVLMLAPKELRESTLALGTTRFELVGMLLRQSLPGLLTAVLLAFGRAIGDGASVMFTAGYTDRLPQGLMEPVATLPLAIFFQLSAPFQSVQERAYASALILTAIILGISVLAQYTSRKLGRNTIR